MGKAVLADSSAPVRLERPERLEPPEHPGQQARLAHCLREHLGPLVGVACTGVDGDPESLYPDELAHVARAIPRRQREYAAGRQAARQAMAAIGWPAAAVATAPDRSPTWPAGLIGSIAHCRSACVAVVARASDLQAVGIDLEDDRPLDPDLWPIICTPDEQVFLHAQPCEQRGALAMRLFTAKEAVYKWQHPQTGQMLDFHDVQVTLDLRTLRFTASAAAASHAGASAFSAAAPRRTGQLFIVGKQVLACFSTPMMREKAQQSSLCSPIAC